MRVLFGSAVIVSLALGSVAIWKCHDFLAIDIRSALSAVSNASSRATEKQHSAARDEVSDLDAQKSGAIEPNCLLFTAEGFDLDKMLALIDGADIGERQKAALKATISSSAINPEFLQQSLDNARETLGL